MDNATRLVVALENRPRALEIAQTATINYAHAYGSAQFDLVAVKPVTGLSDLERMALILEGLRRAELVRHDGGGGIGIAYADGVESARTYVPRLRRCFPLTVIAASDEHGFVNARFQGMVPEDHNPAELESRFGEMVELLRATRTEAPTPQVDEVGAYLLNTLMGHFDPKNDLWRSIN